MECQLFFIKKGIRRISYKESREIYRARINRGLDYIDKNVHIPLRLDRLAEICGYQPDDKPCFENYRNDPQQHPEGKCIVDICVFVKPL